MGCCWGWGRGRGLNVISRPKLCHHFSSHSFYFPNPCPRPNLCWRLPVPVTQIPIFLWKKRGKSFSCDGNMSALVPSLDMLAILMKTRSILALKSFVILQGAKIFYGFKLTSFVAARVEKVVSSFPSFIISLCSCRQSLHIPNENNNDMWKKKFCFVTITNRAKNAGLANCIECFTKESSFFLPFPLGDIYQWPSTVALLVTYFRIWNIHVVCVDPHTFSA